MILQVSAPAVGQAMRWAGDDCKPRLDPRRQNRSMGLSFAVGDCWGILHTQPVFLNDQRPAGAASPGVVRHEEIDITELTVDTRGDTDFAMAVAKLRGFDPCQRLYRLRDRHLHVPRGFAGPATVADFVQRDVPVEPLGEACEVLLRLIAAQKWGWRSAATVVERFGSDTRGDRLHRAGHALGRLLRAVSLCDYFTLPDFRRSTYQVLERGESVHALQRQFCTQALPAKRGRSADELIAIARRFDSRRQLRAGLEYTASAARGLQGGTCASRHTSASMD